jgi:hypothetical protein
MNERTISDYALAEIELLATEGITDLTPAEIIEINALAREADNPAVARMMARGIPVEVGGAWLWPLTLRAADWYSRVGCIMAREHDREAALGYAMAHGRADDMSLCIDGPDALRAVRRWISGLSCTMAEYRTALAEILDQGDDHAEDYRIERPGETRQPGMSIADVSAQMVALCGGTPDQWERACSMQYALAVMRTALRQASADGKSAADDARLDALARMGVAIQRIKDKRRAA